MQGICNKETPWTYLSIPRTSTGANIEDHLSCRANLHISSCSIISINEQSPSNAIIPFPSPSDTFLYSRNSQLVIACRRMNTVRPCAPIPHAPSSGDDNSINSNDDADDVILSASEIPKKAILTVRESEL